VVPKYTQNESNKSKEEALQKNSPKKTDEEKPARSHRQIQRIIRTPLTGMVIPRQKLFLQRKKIASRSNSNSATSGHVRLPRRAL
jgi:formiminotetrahydrofolate cyclodeaminase